MRADLPARLFTDTTLARLQRAASVDPRSTDLRALEHAEIILSGWGCPPIDAAILARAPALRAIVHTGGGVKGHVTAACWERGILVSTPSRSPSTPLRGSCWPTSLLMGWRAPIANGARRSTCSTSSRTSATSTRPSASSARHASAAA
jgi:hypothetical protein